MVKIVKGVAKFLFYESVSQAATHYPGPMSLHQLRIDVLGVKLDGPKTAAWRRSNARSQDACLIEK